MKPEKLQIENFRGIEHLELDFQDELGRAQDIIPIVGPNTSGKTSLLDAITLCLGPVTEIWTMRPDLVYTPASLVRRGSVRAHVACTVRFSNAEIESTKEVFEITGNSQLGEIPAANRVTVHWEYPDPLGKHRRGRNRFEPQDARLLFKGRVNAVRNLHVPGVSPRSLQNLGGVFMFDQKRTGLGHRTHSQLRAREELRVDGDMDGYTHALAGSCSISRLERRCSGIRRRRPSTRISSACEISMLEFASRIESRVCSTRSPASIWSSMALRAPISSTA